MSESHYSQRQEAIEELSEEGFAYVTAVGVLITAIFAWVLFRNLYLSTFFEHVQHEYLQALALAFYYACWVAGTKFDLTTQKWVYLIDPNPKHFPFSSILVVALLTAIAMLLLWTKDNMIFFGAFLLALVISNIIAWLHLLTRILPIIKTSAKIYKKDKYFFGLERLYVVIYYINGRWQWHRFAGMLVLAISLIVFSLSSSVQNSVVGMLRGPIAVMSPQLASDFIFVAFILFAEGWIWIERAKCRLAMKMMSRLARNYSLEPVSGKMKSLEEHWKIEDSLRWWRTIKKSVSPTMSGHRRSRANKTSLGNDTRSDAPDRSGNHEMPPS